MDLKLDLETHDLSLKGRDLALLQGVDLVRQRIKQNLLANQGEWFLDAAVGLPWYEEIFQKQTSEARVRALLIRRIVATQGVEALNTFEMTVDKATRTASIAFSCVADGVTIEQELALGSA